ncbi:hypothetical protein B0H19DRAFT_1076663 [Mycena capillaripes]|nr:hypothetical protein B0H19DRAFT_1076663 [Mycena capillaripes]
MVCAVNDSSDPAASRPTDRRHEVRLQTIAKNAGERGWTIPPLEECNEANGTDDLKGLVHILNKPSRLWWICLPPSQTRIAWNCPHPLTFQHHRPPPHRLILLFPRPTPALHLPPSPLGDRPDKTVLLKPSHPILENMGTIVLSSFDPAPSRAKIFRGHAGTQPIVLKMAEEGRDDETREEGKVYPLRRRRMLADNGQLAYCLVLEDLGVSLFSAWWFRRQLAAIEDALHARGITHLDLEPRNDLRSRTGGIAVVDFEEIARFPKKVSEEVCIGQIFSETQRRGEFPPDPADAPDAP